MPRSRVLLLGAFLAASATDAPADVVYLRNDSHAGGAFTCQSGIGEEETLAARFTAPSGSYPYTIDHVRVMTCGSGNDAFAVFLYQDTGGLNPGPLIWAGESVHLIPGTGEFFDLDLSREDPPPPPIGEGTVRVALYCVVDFGSVGFGTDLGGITPQRNFVCDAAGTWRYAESEGITGDWILRLGIVPPATSVPAAGEATGESVRLRNEPNPFQVSTALCFRADQPGPVSVEVFDARGRRVAVPMQPAHVEAGDHRVAFDAGELADGVYFAALRGMDGIRMCRMLLMR